MMFTEFFQDTLLPALLSIAGVLVTVLTGIAIGAIRKWGERQQNEAVRLVMREAALAAERAVAMVQQTFLDQVKAARVDGHLSKAEATKALQLALDAARVQLGADGIAALARVVGGNERVDQVLTTMVEAAVSKQKAVTQSAADFVGG